MKKILIAGAVAIACIVSAKADYLYWQATEAQYNEVGITDMSTAVSGLWYNDGTGYQQLGNYFKGEATGSFNVASAPSGFSDSSSSDRYTYYIELATYDSSTKTYTSKGSVGSLTYSQIYASSQLTAAQGLAQVKATWGGMTATPKVVPEPTSGLMMLVGMALLGLKRRRA